MDYLYSTTTEHRKGQHLSFEHRVLIQIRLKDGWSPNKIAKEIGCAPNTVRNEIKRGTVVLYKGNILRYKATAGQATYEQNRQVCCRHYDFLEKVDFISFVEKKFFEDGWSLDACVGYALKEGLFTRGQIVCTKTLYSYADLGLLGIKNIHLPEKLRRSSKRVKVRKTKGFLDAASKNDHRKQMTAVSLRTGRQTLSSVQRRRMTTLCSPCLNAKLASTG